MKQLTIYANGSIYRYSNPCTIDEVLEEDIRYHPYFMDENGYLHISKRSLITGETETIAVFRKWEYFLIEGGEDTSPF